MLIMKFGGTSVGSADAIRRAATIVQSRLDKQPIIVSSAVAKTTDELVKLTRLAETGSAESVSDLIEWIIEKHSRLSAELGLSDDERLQDLILNAAEWLGAVTQRIQSEGRTLEAVDQCLSFGEFLSCNILASFLQSSGIASKWVDSRALIVTDSRFGRAQPLYERSRDRVSQILPGLVSRGFVPVTQGFIGADEEERTTTLGRGGSDFSATFLGAAVGAAAVEIWTDVDGVMTADPSLVADVKRIRWMTFQEAAELAYFGARVLHPSTILPAVKRGIPVRVLNAMKPWEDGTEIVASHGGKPPSRALVKSIAYKEGLSVLNLTSTRMLMAYGFLSSIFEIFNRFETPVDLVATSEVSVSVTIDNLERLAEIQKELGRFAEIEVRHGKAIVCIVGENVCRGPGMAARIFSELEGIEVSLISQGASRINISFVIDEADLPLVINRIHKRFFTERLDAAVFAN